MGASAPYTDAVPVFSKVNIVDDTVPEQVDEREGAPFASGDQAAKLFEEAEAAELAGSYPAMMELLNAAAELGSAPAHYALAKHYTAGTTGQRDLLKAETHLAEAAARGYAEAIRVEGWKLIRGDDRPKNLVEGLAKLEKAAEASPRAMRELALISLDLSEPHLHRHSRGRALLERAHAAGDADASFYLSRLLAKEGDQASATAALDAALSRRSARAMAYVGAQKMEAGEVVLAGQLLHEAALLGDAQAMFAYAGLIQIGKVSSDDRPFDTLLWLSLAAERSHPQATKELALQQGSITLSESAAPGRLVHEVASLNEDIRRAKLQMERL